MSMITGHAPPVTSDHAAQIAAVLRLIPPADDTEIRAGIVGAIKITLGPAGLPLWLAWWRKSDSHRDSSAELAWNLARDPEERFGEEFLYSLAYVNLVVRGLARGVA